MHLRTQITDDMKAALKGGDKPRLAALRLLLAAMKQREVDERIELDDSAVISVIEKMLKQRKDSITQYEAAKRPDLADVEKFESSVLSSYMPQGLSAAEIEAIVVDAIATAGAKIPADMGKVINLVKTKVAGRADMGEVSKLVKSKLAGSA